MSGLPNLLVPIPAGWHVYIFAIIPVFFLTFNVVKRRKKIVLKGKKYPCLEILYKDRDVMPSSQAVCIAYYITLPQTYHSIQADFADPYHFSHRYFSCIVYSFLVVPVCSEVEARAITLLLERCKVLIIR